MSGSVPAPLRIEVAGLARDILLPLSGFTIPSRDEILTRRGGPDGIKLYQDLARDGHAGAVLRKRRAAVVSREWTVDAASEDPADERAAQLARAALKRVRFDRACQGLLSAVLTGWAVAEIIWEQAELELEDGSRGTFVVPADIRVRNARRFVWDREMRLRLLTWAQPIDGEPVPDRKFLVARWWAEENEDPYGRGLGHDLFWPTYFKRNGVALWNALIEKFGQPFVYAEYPQGTPDGDRVQLLQAVQDLARGAGLVVPQGTLVKFLEAGMGGSATGRLHADLIQVMDDEISKVVLGETLTTEAGATGARAMSETHDGVREELADADADWLSAELNETLLAWITEINLPGANPPTVWRRRMEQPDLQARAKLDETLFKIGFEPTEEYVRETYGDGYRRLARPAAPAPGAVPPEPEPDPAFATADDIDDAITRMADRLGQDAAAAQAEMLAALRGQVEAATSFLDLEERLLRLSAAMPVQRLAETLGPAFAAAHLAGMAQVQDEAADDA